MKQALNCCYCIIYGALTMYLHDYFMVREQELFNSEHAQRPVTLVNARKVPFNDGKRCRLLALSQD